MGTFDGANPDIYYSSRDEEYLELAKNPEANKDKLQAMVDEAAKEAGYSSPLLYHGTSKKFTSFGAKGTKTAAESALLGYWLSDSTSTATAYSTPQQTDYDENSPTWDEIAKKADGIVNKINAAFDAANMANHNANIGVLEKAFKEYLPNEYRELVALGAFPAGEWYDAGTDPFKLNFDTEQKWETYRDNQTKYGIISDWLSANYAYGRIHPVHVLHHIIGLFDDAVLRKLTENGEISPRIMNLYAKADNLLFAKPPYVRDEDKVAYIKKAAKAKKDGVVFEGMIDGGRASNHYLIFDRSNIKSADPVTYDDNGNIIPLSERFKTDRTGDEAWKNEDIRYSLREGAAEDVERALTDLQFRDEVYLTESTPSIIASQRGARNLPMLMNASHVRTNVFSAEEAQKMGLKAEDGGTFHGLGKTLFLNIIDDLDQIQLAYRGTKNASDPNRRENYFLLVSQHKDSEGRTVNVPVYINQKGQYNRVFIDTNKVATVFGRDDFLEYINKEVRDGNLVRIKNRRVQVGERTAPIAGGYGLNASTDSRVSQKDSVVNTQYMQNGTKNSERDSEGNQPSEGRQEFFKDSNVRNENGNLLKVYHGTPKAGFTTSDPDVRYSGRENTGGNFSEDKYYARQIDKWEKLNDGSYITVGTIGDSAALHQVGIPSGKLYFDVSKIKVGMTKHGDHLSAAILKQIPQMLNEPIVIVEYRPGMNTNTVNVYGDLYANGHPVTVGVVVTLGRSGTVISKVRTTHAKSALSTGITDGSVLYLNENKKVTDKWFQAQGQHVPTGGTKYGYIRSISLSFENSNTSNEKNSEREEISVSTRSLLASALEGVAANSEERNLLKKYKTKIGLIEQDQQRLSDINAKIKELSFSTKSRIISSS